MLRAHRGKERPPKLRARQLKISFPKQCRWGILGLQEASSGEQVEPVVLGSGRDQEDMAWCSICKLWYPQNAKFQPDGEMD